MRRIARLCGRAQIDYSTHFIALYIAYETWYSALLGPQSGRQAMVLLKRRTIIWEECLAGYCMKRMPGVLSAIYEKTQRSPFLTGRTAWAGVLESHQDWPSLIEYWYAVRCSVVHGIEVPAMYLQLAYEALMIFMKEILRRASRYQRGGGDAFGVDMERFYYVNSLY